MAMRIKLRKVRLQTHQVIQERGVQLKECMEQLEAEHMRLAALFIIQGVIIDVVGGCRDCAFGQVSRQLAKFQEKSLLEAQASQGRACKHEHQKHVESKSPTARQE